MNAKIPMHRTDVWSSEPLTGYQLDRIAEIVRESSGTNIFHASFIVDNLTRHEFESFRTSEIERYYRDRGVIIK